MSNLSAAPGTPQTASKAIAAALVAGAIAFLTALYASVQGKGDTLSNMKTGEWFVVVLGALVTATGAAAAAYATRNKPV